MKIKSVRLSNVSSYAGESFFDFGIEDKKSIVLIGGQNGTGKTSLFTAIKVALYGHLCFNYQSSTGLYISKIKELINHDAFTTNEVKAYIEVEVEMPDNRDFITYTVRREWDYQSQRLSENFSVISNGKMLKQDELVFFQNYLFTILPPNLFDFFFFDGEEIADFFSSSNYNSYVKKAVLTLCSFDTFETIRKFSENYIASNSSDSNSSELTEKYNELQKEIHQITEQLKVNETDTLLSNEELTILEETKMKIQEDFKKSGGLSEEEKDKLLKKSNEYEKIKSEANLRLRAFVEQKLPFIIAKDLSPNIKATLDKELELSKIKALSEKLNSTEVQQLLVGVAERYTNPKQVNDLISDIVSSILSSNPSEFELELEHGLSNEQLTKVNTILSTLDSFSADNILKTISNKEKATKSTIKINKQIREAMSDNDAEKFAQKIESLTVEEFQLKAKIEKSLNEKSILEEKLELTINQGESIRNALVASAKEQSIYEMTHSINHMMDKVIARLIKNKFHEIEKQMLSILSTIMRKDNFIDLIELDNDFNIYSYKEQDYKLEDIKNLIKNIGLDDLQKRLGSSGVKKILKTFNVDTFTKLKSELKNESGQLTLSNIDSTIKLYKKIEFSQLSKGEKQIFILALYFAIIKVSGKDIPFIIDTPYARIDTEHREQISKVFFPEISKQVIILSTDEEITESYYEALKPFIAKEYLLTYNEQESKTTVQSGYFSKES